MLDNSKAAFAKLVERHPKIAEFKRQFSRTYQISGIILRETQEFSKSEDELKTAIQLLDQLVTAHPDATSYSIELVRATMALANLAGVRGQTEEQIEISQDALNHVNQLKIRHPEIPIIAFPREAGERYIGFARATGADCVALDNSVSPQWAADNVQIDGCVQGNLDPRHMVTGGQALVDETRQILRAFSGGPHIFNLGHGITPTSDTANVQLMIDTVRGA